MNFLISYISGSSRSNVRLFRQEKFLVSSRIFDPFGIAIQVRVFLENKVFFLEIVEIY